MKKAKKSLLIFTVFVLIASMMVQPFTSQSAQAKVFSDMTAAEQAQSWWFYKYFESCIGINKELFWNFGQGLVGNGELPQKDVESGNWWTDSDTIVVNLTSPDVVAGFFLRDSIADIGDDGLTRCGNSDTQVIPAALSLWAINPIDMMCTTEVLKRHDNKPCIDATNNFNAGPGFGDRKNLILGYIQDKVYGGNSPPNLNDASRYYYYLQTFKNSCVWGSRANGTVLSAPTTSSGEWEYIIAEPVNGEMATVKYVGDKKKTDEVFTWPGKTKMTCGELEQALAPGGALASAAEATPGGVASVTPQTIGTGSEAEEGCSIAVGVFGWLLCPVVDMANGVFQFFINRLKSVLFIEKSFFEADAQGRNGLKESWANVRNVANTLIVLVGLIIIASQIFGFKFLDAYTVKTLLPKLIVAVIFIQLSWFVFTTLIDLINAIGLGIHGLLLYPFTNGSSGSSNIADLYSTAGSQSGSTGVTSILALITGSAGAIIGAGALAISGAWLTVVFAIIGALISMLVALFVLLARQIVILVLITLAPLAIIAWVLPSTQNWWKSWWTLFIKLLLMFPLIMILFAGGAIAANVIADTFVVNTDGGESAFGIVAMIVAYFAPIFLVVGTFKFAGGMFGKIVDVTNKGASKAKGFGYLGMKGRAKESYQENKKAKGFTLVGQNQTTRGPRGTWNRARGRLMAGTLGASGSYGEKLRTSETRSDFENARLEADSVIKSAGEQYMAQRRARNDILRAATGSEVVIYDASGNEVRRVIATQRLQRATALEAARNKEHDALDAYQTTSGGDLSNYTNTNSEAFSVFDKYVPDISRGADFTWTRNLRTGAYDTPNSFQVGVNQFGNIGNNRRSTITREIRTHLLAPTSSTEQKRQAIGYLTSMARNSDLAEADLATLARDIGISDLSKLRTNPKARLEIDATGTVVVEDT